MLDAFSYWIRLTDSWRLNAQTGERAIQTARASGDVIASRTGTMADALISPLSGDYVELSGMVPEKVAAFAASGTVVIEAWWAMQSDAIEQGFRIGTMMMRGRPPPVVEWADAASRSGRYALRALEASSRLGRDALAPVHAAATANARRLGQRSRAS